MSIEKVILEEIERFISNLNKKKKIERKDIKDIQDQLCAKLEGKTKGIVTSWKPELNIIKECVEKNNYEYNDRADILGKGNNILVIIEIDASRADQIAKKFVSRMALTIHEKNVLYISLCYQGSDNNNRAECSKYFDYCKDLAEGLSNTSLRKSFFHRFLD